MEPGEGYPSLTRNGAWCWFSDPRAVSYEGRLKRTYVGWVTKEGHIQVAAYDHQTRKIETAILREKLQSDDHANPSILIRPDGRLQVFYSKHSRAPMLCRISKRPEDILEWEEELALDINMEGRKGVTYSNPYVLQKEGNRIHLFWRGGDFKPNHSTSMDGITWSQAKTFIQGPGSRPYIKFVSDGQASIHMAFTDGHPRNEPENSIYYLCYRGGALFKADGTRIKALEELPVHPSEAERVYDAKASGSRAWIWDIALDHRGFPVIAYTACPQETDHRYRYARWDGSRWHDHQIATAGRWFPQTPSGKKEREPHYSGGLILDHHAPSVVYLSRQVNGVFEIERWETGDLGQTWTSASITQGSARLNVRPFVSRGTARGESLLLWMHGAYVHYTNYDVEIKMQVVSR